MPETLMRDYAMLPPRWVSKRLTYGASELSLGRSAVARSATDVGRNHGAGCGASVCARAARAADLAGVSRRAGRPLRISRNGGYRAAGGHSADGLRRSGTQLCELWSHRSRNRASRFGISIHDERPIVVGDAAHLSVWYRGPEAQVSAAAGTR